MMEVPHPGAPLGAAPSSVLTPGALSPDGVWRWDGTGWVPSLPVSTPSYRPLAGLPRVVAGVLLAAGLAQLVGLGALTGRLQLLGQIAAGGDVSPLDAAHSDDVVRASAFLQLGAGLLCAILFLTWLHRVVANNAALGARALRFTPGAAIGWWFVPLANWVMPYRVVAEAWRAADPQLPWSTPDQRAMRSVPALLSSWWLALAGGSVLASIANVTGNSSTAGLDALHTATLLFMAASLLLAGAGVLGAVTVLRLSRRQDALRDAAADPATAPGQATA